MAMWEMFVPWIPYNESWISFATAAFASFLVGIASVSVIFYAPLVYAAMRLKAKGNMPPIPPGRIGIPFWGESLGYLKSWSNLLDLDVWYDMRKVKNGKIFTTHILGSPTVVMLGAEANKFILTNEDKLFRNSWPKSLRVLIGERAMTSCQGADYKRMRRIIHSFLGIETLKKSIGRFERIVLHHLDSDWRSGEIIHAHHRVRDMALCVAAEFFLGLKAGEELERFRVHFNDFYAGLLSHPLDLPWTVFGKAKRARAAIVAQIASKIRLHRSSFSASGEEDENFMGMVLRAQKAGGDFVLNDEEITDNLMGLLTGGYDTTASALATILKYLSLSPWVLRRLRKDCEKLRDSKKEGEPLTWNEIKSVEYMHNVISEGLRIVPPINGAFKQAKMDVVYNGYTIPKGWKVHYSISQTNNKDEYFQSPKTFDPDRFNMRHKPFTYIPFGQGIRICPGNEYAKIEMEVFLYHFVLRYDWDLVEANETLNMYFSPQPIYGLPLVLKTIA
ncbi:hypothetical protein SUGI_0377720 [Cryptomeria japonica]|uniref:cytochrome P450 716B1-like n=1 Tax=Cryptomeria japonica TaxID=3369 RepID=UPI002408C88E|nr:cytochrome P450 716B1-like [Cryptomeria japonica]GLJ20732.1 hypothetical protein SUGI_0377720 [Cryptomeria japonica]